MRPYLFPLALSVGLCVGATSLHAQSPVVATISCNAGWSASAYFAAVDVQNPPSSGSGLLVAFDPSAYPALVADVANATSTACTLAAGPATVTLNGISLNLASVSGQSANLPLVGTSTLELSTAGATYLSSLPEAYAETEILFSSFSLQGLGSSSVSLPEALRALGRGSSNAVAGGLR